MTGPNPDAELDAALGVTGLPPAAITYAHRDLAAGVFQPVALAINSGDYRRGEDLIAQAIADAERRGAARVLAEHRAGGTQ